MDGLSLNAEPIFDDETEEFDIDGECTMTEYVGLSGLIEGENPVPPDVGMEFETYEDVYYFYNCYAKVQGFGVRVSNTWYRKSRERYRGKLSCSSAGFKKKSEANRPRPETRTGCPAMIKFRLMENKRWKIIEVELEHNHLINPSTDKFYKCHRNVSSGSKRPLQMNGNQDVQKIKLFRTVIIDPDDDGKLNIDQGEFRNTFDQSNTHLILKPGDAQAILSFFTNLQLVNPDFFYVMDLNEKGCLRNVFWAEARFKAMYSYFGDVVRIDTACLISKYEVPLVLFSGVNHHGQSVPLGCGLVAGETVQSFIWLLRAWLTYMVGRPPQTVIIDQSRAMQTAIADVLPRASHCISLSHIMKKVPEELGRLHEYGVIKKAFAEAVYQSSRKDEFEAAWEDMMLSYGISDHKWLQTLHEDCKQWVPVYLKDTFLAGMFAMTLSEREASPFDEYLSSRTPLKEFLDGYNQCLKEIYQREALADSESRNPSCMFKSRFYFEMQVSKIYTNHIFDRFQVEIEGMFSCLSTRQVGIDGSIVIYVVKEHEVENANEARDYEVMFNTAVAEVICVCGLFNLEGFLCRHALCVLSQNGFEEIPPQYILSRWRKDIHRSYVLDYGCNFIDTKNPVHRYDNLYKCAVKLVEEGRKSHERYKFTLEALGEILNTVSLQDHNTL
ncbi:protein FAR1-RELATED SEQUENCE 6-like [Lycium barbarum]|uniref:protein FAR1-RELATED SEQUENCE 6-like n=1 Tax=Lycium barbarum TaxID=112863 RepID=UPI00293F3ADB|nr:protein FAR1-RELATED SEQUENCE 6-like [Lycium barbarum]